MDTNIDTHTVVAGSGRWRNVLAANAPGCSQGTPYSFWVREANPDKIAIVFAGGGACWNGENAALHCRPSYRPFAGLEQDPSGFGGVFDVSHPKNPLANHTIVYLPTANGDAFLGDAIVTYDTPAMNGHPEGQVTIRHQGFPNAMSALNWVFGTYSKPEKVAVMGWSAGAIASPLYTHIVASRYPQATVTHFADGAGAYRAEDRLLPLFNSWGTQRVLEQVPGFDDLDVRELSLEDLYIRAAQLNPRIVFHQFNQQHDQIQALFLSMMGVAEPDVAANIKDGHNYIKSTVSNFQTFTSWGNDEGIIGGYYDSVPAINALDNRGAPHVLDRLYTYKTNGVRFLDWFSDAINARPVHDVECFESTHPEYDWKRPPWPS